MRAIPFQLVYESIVSRHGLDPSQPVPHNLAQAIPRNVNKRLRTAWTYWEWPYIEQCDERAFQRIWNPNDQFKAGEKVIFIRNMQYYQALDAPGSGPPIGAEPTDPAYWQPLADYGHLILFDQICRRPMGMVLGVYPSDPRVKSSSCQCGLYYRPEDNGIAVCGGHGPSVFVKYQLPVPRFTLTPYAPGKSYQTGALVYDGISGECYIATVPSQNVLPQDPTSWLKVEFPEIFEDYVVIGAYADGLKETDQNQPPADQQQIRMAWAKDAESDAEEKLVEEIDKLRAMGQRYHYRAWKQAAYAMRCSHPGVCLSEPFDPTGGTLPPELQPPVTTLTEICETDPTYPAPPIPSQPKVVRDYHPEIVKLKSSSPAPVGPALSGVLSKQTLAPGALIEIVIVPAAGANEQAQRWQLNVGAADPGDPGQLSPDDFDAAYNNVHWSKVG